jgi:hypothetical protein
MGYTNGYSRRMLENIVITRDGLQQAWGHPFLQNGQPAGRTLIDECRVCSDWQALGQGPSPRAASPPSTTGCGSPLRLG